MIPAPLTVEVSTPLSYWDYLQAIVSRYATSPALGMWEPMSEAEASNCSQQYQPTSCSGRQSGPDEAAAAASLRYFFDTVGGEIHALDPRDLVESGLLGGGQCGSQGADYGRARSAARASTCFRNTTTTARQPSAVTDGTGSGFDLLSRLLSVSRLSAARLG